MKKVVVFIIFAIFFLGMRVTAYSGNRGLSEEELRQLDQYEVTYKKNVMEVLSDNYMENSGLNMNKTIDEDGHIEYVISIYYGKADRMRTERMDRIISSIQEIPFEYEDAGFSVTIEGMEDSF